MTRMRRRRANDAGFTLVELLLALLIGGIIVSALGSALVVSLETVGATGDRIAQSHDAQLLSFWLLPDIQSVPDTATTNGVNTTSGYASPCTGESGLTNVLGLTWTDFSNAASPVTYYADYRPVQVGGQWTLQRFYCSSSALNATTVTAVNNLSSSTAAAATNNNGLVTMTVKTVIGNPAQHFYTFSVTGGGRAQTSTPQVLEPISEDLNHDGQLDHIIVPFNRTLQACSGSCSTGPWKVSNVPKLPSGTTNETPTAVTVGTGSQSNDVILTVPETGFVDTADTEDDPDTPSGVTVSTTGGTGITALNGAPVTVSTATAVRDGMAPVLVSSATSPESQDEPGPSGPIGVLSSIDLTFSEPVSATSSWTLSGTTGTPGTATYVGNVVQVPITGAPVDTATSTLKIAGSVVDGAGNASAVPMTTVNDGMVPVLVGVALSNKVGGTPGLIETGDTIALTFSEPVSSLPPTPTLTVLGGGASGTTETFTISGLITIKAKTGAAGTYGAVTAPLTVSQSSNGVGDESVVTLTVSSPVVGAVSGPTLIGNSMTFSTAPQDVDSSSAVIEPPATPPNGKYF